MEELEVHSKSYLVRWIYVHSKHTIAWSIQPHKKSLNFGIFKHPGGHHDKDKPLSILSDAAVGSDSARENGANNNRSSGSVVSAQEKLTSIGMKQVLWIGRCDADKIAQGSYHVGPNPEDAGNYGLVFDNTFSKTVSKTVTFVLLTYLTDHPPHFNHQIHHPQQTISHSTQNSRASILPAAAAAVANGTMPASANAPPRKHSNDSLSNSVSTVETTQQNLVHTGVLQKRRRKRHQGYARRFFSLDFQTQTLSYYHDRNSPAMRGAMPLDFAAIGYDDFQKEFSIDSGAEIWHLRALNSQSYESWKKALEKASSLRKTHTNSTNHSSIGNAEHAAAAAAAAAGAASEGAAPPMPASRVHSRTPSHRPGHHHSDVALDYKLWSKIEDANVKIARSREIARRLARDTDPKYLAHPHQHHHHHHHHHHHSTPPPQKPQGRSPSPTRQSSISKVTSNRLTPTEGNGDAMESAENIHRRSFWKIRSRDGNGTAAAGTTPTSSSTPDSRRTPSSQHATSSSSNVHLDAVPPNHSSAPTPAPAPVSESHHSTMHDDLMSVFNDLNTAVSELSAALEHKRLTKVNMSHVTDLSSRASFDSEGEDEFFDALDETSDSPLLIIQTDASDNEEVETPHTRAPSVYEEEAEDDGARDSSDTDESDVDDDPPHNADAYSSLFPVKCKSLTPLPLQPVTRRATIPPPAVHPPSLISFLRKNVGKDLSAISMPVSANEPISLLQRASEQLEYCALLDKAAAATDGVERLIYITAFAISPLSGVRLKERAARKPFNPMLGETYELVREDLGFRFIAEKVSHRPVQLSFQADSRDWSLSQSPKPTQQFWGKSAEIITEGKLRLSLHTHAERYSWSPANCSLKNIIAGEKYVEPTGEMVVVNETTGEKTVTTFKAGGMFSGRSEELATKTFDSHGKALPLGLQGSWAESIKLTENGALTNTTIWSAGPLVKHPQKHWGYTQFAATLNEITHTEKGHIPPTDSRLRPDQRALEEGQVDRAEEWKEKLEVAQRVRRRDMESKGESWTPRWFTKLEGDLAGTEEVWKLKAGKDGYWEERASGKWTGVVPVLNA